MRCGVRWESTRGVGTSGGHSKALPVCEEAATPAEQGRKARQQRARSVGRKKKETGEENPGKGIDEEVAWTAITTRRANAKKRTEGAATGGKGRRRKRQTAKGDGTESGAAVQ